MKNITFMRLNLCLFIIFGFQCLNASFDLQEENRNNKALSNKGGKSYKSESTVESKKKNLNHKAQKTTSKTTGAKENKTSLQQKHQFSLSLKDPSEAPLSVLETLKLDQFEVSDKRPLNFKGSKEEIQMPETSLSPNQTNALEKSLVKRNVLVKKPDGEAEELESISSSYEHPVDLARNTVSYLINKIEELTQYVLKEKRADPLVVRVNFASKEDVITFNEAFNKMVERYSFPFNWSSTNKGPQNPTLNDLNWEIEINLSSKAKFRERVEKEYIYQVDQQLHKEINWPMIYEVAMRSGFDLEDFKFNNSLKVRVLELQGTDEDEYIKQIKQFLEVKLPKDSNPFHVIGIKLTQSSNLKANELLSLFFKKGGRYSDSVTNRGIVCDNENNFLYLCFNNDRRNLLDLHGKKKPQDGTFEGRNVKQARAETLAFILNAYESFQEDISVLTGRGNHVNANGKKGILNQVFEKEWVKDDSLKPIIKSFFPITGNGGYKVLFAKPTKLNLDTEDTEVIFPLIKQKIAEMVNKKRQRLVLNINADVKAFYNQEFGLLNNFARFLSLNDISLFKSISPLSFDSEPGQLRLIFNKLHARYPEYIIFGDSFGNSIAAGNIGIY